MVTKYLFDQTVHYSFKFMNSTPDLKLDFIIWRRQIIFAL